MESSEIEFTDWLRILVGEVPAEYFVELAIRAFIIYLILMVSMRSMGKRMSSQLSRNELAALVSLAAAVGVPLMAPDRGVLPAVVIAFVLIKIESFVARQNCKSERFENFSQGKVSTLVSDGVVSMKELERLSLSHERVFAQLRSSGVLQLGTVSRLYLEAGGNFTLVSSPEPVPGLSVLPPWDHELADRFIEHADKKICVRCGFPQKGVGKPYGTCPNCKAEKWVNSVKEIDIAAEMR